MGKKEIDKMFGINTFHWEEWDEIDSDTLQFYNVKFLLESMKIFNGCTVTKDFEGRLIVYSNDGKVLYDDYIINIPEFKMQLLAKYK